MNKHILLTFVILFLISGCIQQQYKYSSDLPRGFVYIEDIIPDIKTDIRYAGNNNFIGKRIDGYLKPRCILTAKAAYALKNVQEDLKKFGLSLTIFDAYRPQQAVDHFVRWSKNPNDNKMKKLYYPKVDKADLIEQEYIAAESSHTRGSAVDLTIVSLKDGNLELDMGTIYDFFDVKSSVYNKSLNQKQRSNRMLLNTLMSKHGFVYYDKEWWHFKLRKEPFPKTYFNFPVK